MAIIKAPPTAMPPLEPLISKAIDRRRGHIPNDTTVYRLINGAGDELPGLTVDRYGNVLLIQSQKPPPPELVQTLKAQFPQASIYYKMTSRFVRCMEKSAITPELLHGAAVHGSFPVLENGITYLVSMESGYSTGIFSDQRNNRRSIRDLDLRGKTVLNTFAYTCAFSVCAALAGATVTSLDLSKKYLDWGRENFRVNKIDDKQHDFIFGDIFDWLPRFAKKQRRWDLIILDPPTFSTGKSGRRFKATEDYPNLLDLTQNILEPEGIILCCINTHDFSVDEFKKLTGIAKIRPLEIDYPIPIGEEPHLKSGWIHSSQ